MRLIATGQLPAKRFVTKRTGLDEAVPAGFEAQLDPGGTQLNILLDLSK